MDFNVLVKELQDYCLDTYSLEYIDTQLIIGCLLKSRYAPAIIYRSEHHPFWGNLKTALDGLKGGMGKVPFTISPPYPFQQDQDDMLRASHDGRPFVWVVDPNLELKDRVVSRLTGMCLEKRVKLYPRIVPRPDSGLNRLVREVLAPELRDWVPVPKVWKGLETASAVVGLVTGKNSQKMLEGAAGVLRLVSELVGVEPGADEMELVRGVLRDTLRPVTRHCLGELMEHSRDFMQRPEKLMGGLFGPGQCRLECMKMLDAGVLRVRYKTGFGKSQSWTDVWKREVRERGLGGVVSYRMHERVLWVQVKDKWRKVLEWLIKE